MIQRQVTVRLFGLLKQYGEKIDLRVADGARLGDIPGLLVESLRKQGVSHPSLELLDQCALGDEREILTRDLEIHRDMEVALLPPVCGG